jgi:exonuclease III
MQPSNSTPPHNHQPVNPMILSWNCNSLNGKLRALNDLINPILHPHTPPPALIALCELKLKPYHFTRCPPRLSNYLFVSASLADHPGAGFFVHSSLPHRHRTDLPRPLLQHQKVIDICWL